MLIMRHDIGVEWLDRSREEHHVDFVVYGEPGGYSAMAKTVGYPTAIATKMVLEGKRDKCKERGKRKGLGFHRIQCNVQH